MRTPLAILGLFLAACGSSSREQAVAGSRERSAASSPALVARLIDERAQPLAGVSLHYFLCTDGDSPSPGRDGWLRSDQDGYVRLVLRPDELSRDPKYFHLSDLRCHDTLGQRHAEFYLPIDLPGGELDLGDLLIAPRGSLERFKKWSDREIQAEYERLGLLHSPREELYEELLCEMIRRGGSEWATFVETEWMKRSRSGGQPAFGGFAVPGDLALLTAARRLRGAPDPLAIRVEAGAPLEFSATEQPRLQLQWCNVDPQAAFTLSPPAYAVVRCGGVNLEIVDASGRMIPPRQQQQGENDMMGGWSHPRSLAPGQTEAVSLRLAEYMPCSVPGEYRLRVRYHDQCCIVEGQQYRGLVVSSSPEFTVRIRAP